VLLPSSPLQVLLAAALDRPLVMTSGNRSDEPVAHDEAEVATRLGALTDGGCRTTGRSTSAPTTPA